MNKTLLLIAIIILGAGAAGCVGPYTGAYDGYGYQPAPFYDTYPGWYGNYGFFYGHGYTGHRQILHHGHGAHFDRRFVGRPHGHHDPAASQWRRFDQGGERRLTTVPAHGRWQSGERHWQGRSDSHVRQEAGHRFESGGHHHGGGTWRAGDLQCQGRRC